MSLVHTFCAPDAEQIYFGMLKSALFRCSIAILAIPVLFKSSPGPCGLCCGWLQGYTLPLGAVSGHQQCSCRALSQSWPLCYANLGQP